LSRILIAEDEARLARFLERGLQAAGYATMVCGDGVLAASLARDEEFDLLLLDLGLPGQNGFDVLRAVRGRNERIPVVVLSARDRVEDVVLALDEGADDYLTKPFVFDELLARVRARTRTAEAVVAPATLGGPGLRLDLRTRRALTGDAEVDLTAREFRLLEVFLRHHGQVLSRDQLIDHAWGPDALVGPSVVDVYVSSLRRKLGADRIETMRGFGYRVR
jgi:two-component system, OmpR family, copper resistance phosphate regulon response regulator CusR